MTFGRDSGGFEKVCHACGSATQSHPAPNGYLCHTCVTGLDEAALFDALPVEPIPELGPETTVPCVWCGATHTIRDAHTPGGATIRGGVGFPVFDSLSGFVWVSCPTCTKSTEFLTTEEQAEALASTLEVPLMNYDRRQGWVE